MNLQTKADELRNELAETERLIDEFKALPEEHRLATLLHSKFCHWNHTDGCSWYYAEKDWTEYSHKMWAEKAAKVLAVSDYAAAEAIIEVL